ERAELGVACARGVLQHRLEHRLQLAWRAADDLQDLRGSGLLLQRFGQFARACPLRLEQPRVLDRDYRLGCEALKQLDLAIGERSDLQATNDDRADGNPLAKQRRRQNGAIAKTLRQDM